MTDEYASLLQERARLNHQLAFYRAAVGAFEDLEFSLVIQQRLSEIDAMLRHLQMPPADVIGRMDTGQYYSLFLALTGNCRPAHIAPVLQPDARAKWTPDQDRAFLSGLGIQWEA